MGDARLQRTAGRSAGDAPKTTDNEPSREARILARVRAIPRGFVRTYGDIDPAAPRLVGRVLATTKEEVPWHRVVRADGSAPMGQTQLVRLRKEGVPMRGDRVDLPHARVM
jgi:alkylated DNA nucleotide flippase Atl1